MRTAKQMFEELGFKEKTVNGATYYIAGEGEFVKRTIMFFDTTYHTVLEYFRDEKYIREGSVGIFYKLHQAITQQMIELGWLK